MGSRVSWGSGGVDLRVCSSTLQGKEGGPVLGIEKLGWCLLLSETDWTVAMGGGGSGQ